MNQLDLLAVILCISKVEWGFWLLCKCGGQLSP
jgi:hypothetical protein